MDPSKIQADVSSALRDFPALARVYCLEWLEKSAEGLEHVWQCHPFILMAMDSRSRGGLVWQEAALHGFRRAGLKLSNRLLGNMTGWHIPNYHSAWSEVRVAAWLAEAGATITSFDRSGEGDMELEIDNEHARVSLKTPYSDWDDFEARLVDALDTALSHPCSLYVHSGGLRYTLAWPRGRPRVGAKDAQPLIDSAVHAVGQHLQQAGTAVPCNVPRLGIQVSFYPDDDQCHPTFSHGPGSYQVNVEPEDWFSQELRKRCKRCKKNWWGRQLQDAPGLKVLAVDTMSQGLPWDTFVGKVDRATGDPFAASAHARDAIDVVIAYLFCSDNCLLPYARAYWAKSCVDSRYPATLRLLTTTR